jgi:hypothetical protein
VRFRVLRNGRLEWIYPPLDGGSAQLNQSLRSSKHLLLSPERLQNSRCEHSTEWLEIPRRICCLKRVVGIRSQDTRCPDDRERISALDQMQIHRNLNIGRRLPSRVPPEPNPTAPSEPGLQLSFGRPKVVDAKKPVKYLSGNGLHINAGIHFAL